MKKIKRALALTLTASLGIMALPSAAVQKVEASKTDPYAPVAGKKYNITWTSYQVQDIPKDAKYIKMANEKYNVNIEPINLDNSKYDELLNLRLAAGEIPDHFFVRNPIMLATYVQQGVLAETPEEVMRKYAPEWIKVIEETAPGAMDYGKVKGKQYGVPLMNPTNVFHVPLVYNKTWMDNVGVTKTPTTLKEFEDLMYKFANNDPNKNGIKDTYGLSEQGMLAVYGAYGLVSNGGRFASPNLGYWNVDDKGNVYSASTAPEMKEILEMLAKWYKDGVIDPEFITGENSSSYWANSDAFLRGRIGFTSLGNYYHWLERGAFNFTSDKGEKEPNLPGSNALEIENLKSDAKIVFGEALTGPTGKKGIKAFNMLSGFIAYGRNALKDPGKIGMMLKIQSEVSTEPDLDKRNEWNQGDKDVLWKWMNSEKIDWVSLPPYDKEVGGNNKQGAGFLTRDLYPPAGTQAKWAFEQKFDKDGIFSAIQIGLPSEGKLKAELIKIRDTAYIAIITGQKPVSYFDEYVTAYNKAGGTTLEKEANEWYKANVLHK